MDLNYISYVSVYIYVKEIVLAGPNFSTKYEIGLFKIEKFGFKKRQTLIDLLLLWQADFKYINGFFAIHQSHEIYNFVITNY